MAIEYRWAERHLDRMPALAADLVGRKVDLIVATNPNAALVAKGATSTIPIVFRGGADPVGGGLVASLARPGGNLTGVSFAPNELTAKRLELLSELVPQVKVVGLLVNPKNTSTERVIRNVQEAAGTKGLQLDVLNAGSETEIAALAPHTDEFNQLAASVMHAPVMPACQSEPAFAKAFDALLEPPP